MRKWVEVEALGVSAIGIGIGTTAALLTRLIESFLFGVTARDPLTFVIVPVTLAILAQLAIWVPASRAARVSPTIALRSE